MSTQKKVEKLLDSLKSSLDGYFYLDATGQSSEEGAEEEIISMGKELLLLLKNCMPPTKKYSELYEKIVPTLFNFFLECDFCKHTGNKLWYYDLEDNENLICMKCYKKHHSKVCQKNEKLAKKKENNKKY
jgi:hypothetical protein